MSSTKNGRVGICALTGATGPFVKSHLIPRAVTRLSTQGEKFIETGIGAGLKHRADSWYDLALCTREGEDLLEVFDDVGIKKLRRNRMLWSSWDSADVRLPEAHAGENPVFRFVEFDQPHLVQLFFLSLLWRAAVSKLPEFADIALSAADVDDLRERIVKGDAGNFLDYPVQFFQLVSRGPSHNRTPLLERKPIIHPDGSMGEEISYVRFYFDGLVSHVHLARRVDLPDLYAKTCLGPSGKVPVFGHEYDQSRTIEDLQDMVMTVSKEQAQALRCWRLGRPCSDGAEHARAAHVISLVDWRSTSESERNHGEK